MDNIVIESLIDGGNYVLLETIIEGMVGEEKGAAIGTAIRTANMASV